MSTTECTHLIDLSNFIQPLLMTSIFREGEGIDISKIIEAKINIDIMYQVINQILPSISDESMRQIACLMAQTEEMKAVTGLLRGEAIEVDISKAIELVVNLQLMESLGSAFGGGSSGGS